MWSSMHFSATAACLFRREEADANRNPPSSAPQFQRSTTSSSSSPLAFASLGGENLLKIFCLVRTRWRYEMRPGKGNLLPSLSHQPSFIIIERGSLIGDFFYWLQVFIGPKPDQFQKAILPSKLLHWIYSMQWIPSVGLVIPVTRVSNGKVGWAD